MKAAAAACTLAILAACDGGTDTSNDPRIDAPGGQPTQDCYGTGLLNVCLGTATHTSVAMTGTLTTTTSARCSPERPECVIVGTNISIGSLRVLGNRPLVIVADHTITIDGDLDASSKRGATEHGAGANPASCAIAQTAVQQGGGSGGTYAGRGGDGGAGGSGSVPSGPVPTVTEFLGGCPGSRGDATQFGAPGAGGGAVFLIARERIVINGSINASGAGGVGAQSGGGAGGGSGGFIGLDAPSITITGSVFANGGGGGEGGPAGANGADATLGGAPGGTGGAGGDGGAGSAGTTKSGESGAALATGGGGGGGGAGIVMIIPPQQTGGSISPVD